MKRALIIESKSAADKSNYGLMDSIRLNQFDLISIFGKDCTAWEEIVDETIVGTTGEPKSLPITTSHPGEGYADVQTFVRGFFSNEDVDIKTQRI